MRARIHVQCLTSVQFCPKYQCVDSSKQKFQIRNFKKTHPLGDALIHGETLFISTVLRNGLIIIIIIMSTETDSKCRLCLQFDETIDHIISACPILTKEQYTKRHDRVCAQLHFNIRNETGVQLNKKHWYEHVPKSVETSKGGKVTILWNQQV
jgi:hypothetical protein